MLLTAARRSSSLVLRPSSSPTRWTKVSCREDCCASITVPCSMLSTPLLQPDGDYALNSFIKCTSSQF